MTLNGLDLTIKLIMVELNFFLKFLHYFSCQFVVQSSGDYAVNFIDPDVIVDWEFIEQVVKLLKIIVYSKNVEYLTMACMTSTIASVGSR